MPDAPPPPKYLVISYNDHQRLLTILHKTPIPREVTDPLVGILTGNMAHLPAALERRFEAAARDAGHVITDAPASGTPGAVKTPKAGKPPRRTRAAKPKKGARRAGTKKR